MPQSLGISDEDKARRHVLGQQLYRLRRRYRYLKDGGMPLNAGRVLINIRELTQKYDSLGGRPDHQGNRL